MQVILLIGGFMKPYNCRLLEATMHEKLANWIEITSNTHPKAAKLGALPVFLITVATKPLFLLASLIEAVVFTVINLIGSTFNLSCRNDLGSSICSIFQHTNFVILSPIFAFHQGLLRIDKIITDVKGYSEYSKALTNHYEIFMDKFVSEIAPEHRTPQSIDLILEENCFLLTK